MYARTHDEKYKKWAELWGSKIIGAGNGAESRRRVLYYYASVLGYQQTKDPALRESALRGAARLEQLYNPTTHLIASWGVKGNDTIIDTMMNLQLLWWASRETGDPKWRDMAANHATRASEWFIRADGSTTQSAHYNPGDSPQQFEIRVPDGRRSYWIQMPNSAAPGELIFTQRIRDSRPIRLGRAARHGLCTVLRLHITRRRIRAIWRRRKKGPTTYWRISGRRSAVVRL